MQAIWQLFDATVIPIMTFGSESWNLTKKENHLQTIHNKAIKTILALPPKHPYQHPTGRNRPNTHKIHPEQEIDHAGPPDRKQGWLTSETHHVWWKPSMEKWSKI